VQLINKKIRNKVESIWFLILLPLLFWITWFNLASQCERDVLSKWFCCNLLFVPLTVLCRIEWSGRLERMVSKPIYKLITNGRDWFLEYSNTNSLSISFFDNNAQVAPCIRCSFTSSILDKFKLIECLTAFEYSFSSFL